jgi:hypothetical protein
VEKGKGLRMIVDTGYVCPEFSHLGLFPFAITDNPQELYNASGYSGPTIPLDVEATLSGVSGIYGPGTFYPSSGTIDQLTRMFWCVKSWDLNVNISRIMATETMICEIIIFDPFLPFPPFVNAFGYCSIGAFAGNNNVIPPPMNWMSKTLTAQDYCSFSSAGLNYNNNRVGNCPYHLYSGANPNERFCSPINPVQKFNDLLCRQSFFSWSPKEEEIRHFITGNPREIKNSPYIAQGLQFRVLNPAEILAFGYRCPVDVYFQDVYSIFSLSIMDANALAISGNSLRGVSGYYPDLFDEQYPFGCLGKSGEVLTTSWGEITGYGVNLKPSGIDIPLVYDLKTGSPSFPINPKSPRHFMPLVHFQMKLKTPSLAVSNSNFCAVNDTLSTIRTRSGQKKIGDFVIRDHISGFTNEALRNTEIMRIPLYATSNTNPSQYFIEAIMQPRDLWVTSSGTPRY